MPLPVQCVPDEGFDDRAPRGVVIVVGGRGMLLVVVLAGVVGTTVRCGLLFVPNFRRGGDAGGWRAPADPRGLEHGRHQQYAHQQSEHYTTGSDGTHRIRLIIQLSADGVGKTR